MGRTGERASGVVGEPLEGGGLVDKSGSLTSPSTSYLIQEPVLIGHHQVNLRTSGGTRGTIVESSADVVGIVMS